MSIWLAILVALAPTFALFIYVAKARKSLWIAFALGAAGWTVALYARLPILTVLPSILGPSLLTPTLFALLAGVFEEGVKYGLMKKIRYLRLDWKHVLSLGLGWGFFEAVLMYAVNMLISVPALRPEMPFTYMLVGAVERNFSVIFHVTMAFVIYRAVLSKRPAWIILAVVLHTAVVFYPTLGLPIQYIEAIILAMAIPAVIFTYKDMENKNSIKQVNPATIPK